jgi:hypothetical protein
VTCSTVKCSAALILGKSLDRLPRSPSCKMHYLFVRMFEGGTVDMAEISGHSYYTWIMMGTLAGMAW